MDSFEASTQFAQILRTLTPSIQSLTRAAHFALKYHQAEDFLIHAITDVINDPKVDLNTKSTIFQFVEVLIHESYNISEQPKSSYNYPYVTALKLVLPKALLQTLPGSNCLSLYNVYCSLKNISKTFKFNFEEYDLRFNSIALSFTDEDEENIQANVEFPDVNEDDEIETQDQLITTWNLLIKKKKQSQYERLRLLKHKAVHRGKSLADDEMFNLRTHEKLTRAPQTPLALPPDAPAAEAVATSGGTGGGTGAGVTVVAETQQPDQEAAATPSTPSVTSLKSPADSRLLTKKQILARMEDDRELHKRSKETLWTVNRPREENGVTEDEFLTSYWNKFKVVSKAEEQSLLDELEELNLLIARSYKDKQF